MNKPQPILDYVIDQYFHLAEVWRQAAAGRFSLDDDDPLAKLYERNAEEIERLSSDLSNKFERLRPEEWAAQNGVTKQTARRWCREGIIDCFEDAKGYMIPRNARPDPERTRRVAR